MSQQPGKPRAASADHGTEHGAAVTIARAEVGAVSVCACGVLTLTLQYISLRLQPGAFRELRDLLNDAQRRLDSEREHAMVPATCGSDIGPLH